MVENMNSLQQEQTEVVAAAGEKLKHELEKDLQMVQNDKTLTQAEKYAAEERDLNARSEAYHAHPSHPSSCLAYDEYCNGSRRCPCENYNKDHD
jgi:hypothetical protein